MGQGARTALATELHPGLPRNASRRIGQRTRTFADVFRVIAADHLEDLTGESGDTAVRTVVDEVIDARVQWPEPSRSAVAVAWAGGVLHSAQVDPVLEIMGAEPSDTDDEVVRLEFMVHLAGPQSPPLGQEVRILPIPMRHQMAVASLGCSRWPDSSAWNQCGRACGGLPGSASRTQGNLVQPASLCPAVQAELVEGLEALDDPTAASEVAREALADLPEDDDTPGEARSRLAAAALRLAAISTLSHDDPIVVSAVSFALEGGAAVGLQARVWAAVDLLGRPSGRDVALSLTDQVTTQLGTEPVPEKLADQWRLLLAFHAGRAGYLTGMQRLLAPLLAGSAERRDAAQVVNRAADDPLSDTRLQIAILEADLMGLPAAADDDRLRLHSALAGAYGRIGDYRRALAHGQVELKLRSSIQGPDHPQTFSIRNNVAYWTGVGGDPRQGLRLFHELLLDEDGALGPRHPSTLKTKANIARLTGMSGNPGEALRLLRELLPDRQQVLGWGHIDTLRTRSGIAFWTGECGDSAEALKRLMSLLPDQARILGQKHPDTLLTRHNIAFATGLMGNPAKALRLFRELLPDRERALGKEHPDTLSTQANIADLSGRLGNPAEALRLFQNLQPEEARVFGPDHPITLGTRNNIAGWTGECGDPVEALRLFREVLPDLERVLGFRHPNTLKTRGNVAGLTFQCGNPPEALRLFQALLADQEKILGLDHPETRKTRDNIAALTKPQRG